MPASGLFVPRHRSAIATSSPTEARLFGVSLSPLGWTFRGGRNRLIILLSGSGRITIGDSEVSLAGPSILWTPAGDRGAVTIDAGTEGAALAIPELELGPAMPAGAVFAEVRNALSQPILGARISAADARRLCTTIGTIEEELKENGPGAQEVIRHHLALLVIAIWRLANIETRQPKPSPRTIVRGFVHLMELHIRDHWTVGDYAAALDIPADRLNTAIRRAAGRTPQDLIHARIMTEAATLLDGSTLQIGQIATILGFKDAAYFSRFFKRLSGISPRAHREGASNRNRPRDTSFAAWP